MLSYITYDCSAEKIPLSKEIEFINSYIELQKLRYDASNISMKVSGNMNSKKIAPMILHTFIDNSFKHGAEQDTGNPRIKIVITIYDNLLFFSAINSKRKDDEYKEKVTGIGLKNAVKRLELIYPDRHDLVINNSENRFSVFFKIEL